MASPRWTEPSESLNQNKSFLDEAPSVSSQSCKGRSTGAEQKQSRALPQDKARPCEEGGQQEGSAGPCGSGMCVKSTHCLWSVLPLGIWSPEVSCGPCGCSRINRTAPLGPKLLSPFYSCLLVCVCVCVCRCVDIYTSQHTCRQLSGVAPFYHAGSRD